MMMMILKTIPGHFRSPWLGIAFSSFRSLCRGLGRVGGILVFGKNSGPFLAVLETGNLALFNPSKIAYLGGSARKSFAYIALLSGVVFASSCVQSP